MVTTASRQKTWAIVRAQRIRNKDLELVIFFNRIFRVFYVYKFHYNTFGATSLVSTKWQSMMTFNIHVSYFGVCILADIDYFIFKIIMQKFMRDTRDFNVISPTTLLCFCLTFLQFCYTFFKLSINLFCKDKLASKFSIWLHKFHKIFW